MFRWYANAGLQWKVLLAPAFLVVVFAGVGVFANHTMRANQTAVQGLMAGPVRNAEVVADFNNAAWRAQVQLYRLMATASNEDDAKKVKSLSADATKALDDLAAQFKVLEGLTFNNTQADKDLADLKGSVADYLKRAASVIDMAEADAGTAMMLMMNAAKDFSLIQSTTDDLADSSKELRDFEIARNELAVGREITLLATITLIGIVIGCVVSFLIGRGIAKPRHRHHECDQAHGGRRFRYRAIRPRHAWGRIRHGSSPSANAMGRSPFAGKTRWACSPTPSARCRASCRRSRRRPAC